jgi:hypothetical protein
MTAIAKNKKNLDLPFQQVIKMRYIYNDITKICDSKQTKEFDREHGSHVLCRYERYK